MKLKKLPSQCIAPLRLKEITLHGIGSYYMPARLEIKPLTILCGTNGSGKSTWLKVLSVLKEALLPMTDVDGKDWGKYYLQRLNHVVYKYRLLNASLLNDLNPPKQDVDWDNYYGPLGSFSVTFTCAKSIKLHDSDPCRDTSHYPGALRLSEFKRDDIIHLRFTQYRYSGNNAHVIMAARYSVNHEYVDLRMQQKTSKGKLHRTLHVGIEAAGSSTSPIRSSLVIKSTDENYEALDLRLEQFVALYCEGVFKISAIRSITDTFGKGTENLEEFKETANRIGHTRYVGENGEHSHFFSRYFSVTPVLDPRKNLSYCATKPLGLATEIETVVEKLFDCHDKWLTAQANPLPPDASALDRLLNGGKSTPLIDDTIFIIFKHPGFWQYLFDHHKNKVTAFQERLAALSDETKSKPDVQTFLMDIQTAMKTGDFIHEKWVSLNTIGFECGMEMVEALKDLYATLLDNLLLANDFFRWVLQQIDKGGVVCENQTSALRSGANLAWVRFLASLPDTDLSSAEIGTLNEWAIQECLADISWHRQRIGLRSDSVFGWWCQKLLGIESLSAAYAIPLRVYLGDRPTPVGYLSSFTPSEEDESDRFMYPYTNRLLGANLDSPDDEQDSYIPGYFSAGLHQVAPILVQTNMMRMNEICAVENPEVHLHPGLQLRFMEFFIENALIGKFSLIETHSDLMIRRVLRAINEEKLPQSWVNIAFVDIKPIAGKDDIWTSMIEALTINDSGNISNWPTGFLDDDEKETEALYMAKFGNRKEDTDAK